MRSSRSADLRWPYLAGFAIASAGGPFAILGLYFTGAVDMAPRLYLETTALGLGIFVVPWMIWRGYSKSVTSSAGLAGFVAGANAPWLATWQARVWAFSYVLYLPYTVTYLVFYLLPAVARVPPLTSDILELGLPVLLIALGSRKASVITAVLSLSAAVQLIGIAVLVGLVLHRTGGSMPLSLATASDTPHLLAGASQVASLPVCISLVFYLGGETGVNPQTMRRSLDLAVLVALATLVLSAILWANAPAAGAASLPGAALALQFAHSDGKFVAAGLILISVAGLIVAEFAALARLATSFFAWPHRRALFAIAAVFWLGDAVSLVQPYRFYNLTITPSLIALYLSQLPVFLAYPKFRRGPGGVVVTDVLLAAFGCAWVLFNLFTAVAGSLAG